MGHPCFNSESNSTLYRSPSDGRILFTPRYFVLWYSDGLSPSGSHHSPGTQSCHVAHLQCREKLFSFAFRTPQAKLQNDGFFMHSLVWTLAGFSYYILYFWLSPEMAGNASWALSVFCLGLFWNSLNWVSSSLAQAAGYFRLSTLLILVSTIGYLLLLPFALSQGLKVLASLWSFRFVVDTLLLSHFMAKKFPNFSWFFGRNYYCW